MVSLPRGYRRENGTIANGSGRRYELDWLRVLIIVGLIPFHVIGLLSVTPDAYLVGAQTNPLSAAFVSFFGLWPMSLLFLVAGASAWFALGRRTTGQYTRERLLRLFVPFLFATLVIIPVQVYAVVSAYPQLLDLNLVPGMSLHGNESFPQFYPPYLAGYAYFVAHFSSTLELIFWGHIWFVPRLLLFALVALPLLLWLRGERGRQFITRISHLFIWPGSILLLGIAIALPRVLAAALYRHMLALSPTTSWDPYNLWAQLGVFLICFLLGYLIYSSPWLLEAVRRDGIVALALGVVLFAALQSPIGHLASVTQATPGGIVITILRTECEWMLVVGVLNIGVRWLTFRNTALDYLTEAAYPLYVLHMPVLIVVGLSVVQSGLPNVIALPHIVLVTLTMTLGLYEFVIKRIGGLRLLFGLKPSPHPAGERNADSMREVGYRPDDHDDGGIAQPVGKR
ncbi:MAG TPA: acyltransferase family protein [Ktedonobacterales bacterium]|nr:acyltransferase family protein [Ktedonobacterales bacterium]